MFKIWEDLELIGKIFKLNKFGKTFLLDIFTFTPTQVTKVVWECFPEDVVVLKERDEQYLVC